MWLPPNLAATFINVTTNAVANTATNTVILAAPGALLRYRLWVFSISAQQNMAAGFLRCIVNIGGNITQLTIGQGGTEWIELPGGYRGNVNTAITLTHLGSVASMNFQATVAVTTEQT